jgi:DNA primase
MEAFYLPSECRCEQLATDCYSEKHIESKIWTKAGAYTEKEEDMLEHLVPRIINEFK